MTPPIVDPEIPYNDEIPGGLQPGRLLRLQGVTNPDADRFNINLQTGPSSKPRDDTALHMSVRLNQGYIARNSYKDGSWEDEQGNGRLPIGQAQSWEILILVDQQDYKIAVNGQHFCEFPHRIPYGDVTHLLIDGDVSITLISWEGIVGVGSESASKFSELNAEVPQGGYGPPPGNYGPPPGYGQPPPNYGYGVPPPPGAQQESGFNSFLEQAQGVLAGAIRSGAAEKLLSGFFSSGQPQQQQGYAHQNAKYGIYPDLPQDMDLNLKEAQMKHQPGPVENLLSNLLSGGNKQQQMQQTSANPSQSQQPQNQQPLDLSSLLSGLLNTKQQQAGMENQTAGTQQQNPSQNVDWGAMLGSLISGGNQQNPQGAVAPGQLPGGPHQGFSNQQNPPSNQQEQNVDWGGLLGSLISGANQQPSPHGPVPAGPPQNPAFNTQQTMGNQQSQGVDWGAFLGGLISGGTQQTQSNATPTQVPLQQQSGQNSQGQAKGIDLNLLLSGLMSAAAAQNATRPIQETGKPPQSTQNPSNTNQQSQGIDLGQILSGLLSNISQPQQPIGNQNASNIPSRQPFGPQAPYQGGGQGGGTNYGQMGGTFPHNQPVSGPPAGPQTIPNVTNPAQGNIQKPSDTKGQSSQRASQEPVEDVSDKLAEVIAAENNSSQQNSAQSRQYGQYPHPQGNQGQGPVESLLSSFLGGGGQSHHQQQPQFGGGESLGGLGSMSGLLQNFAGQILQPRDPNQRQNY